MPLVPIKLLEALEGKDFPFPCLESLKDEWEAKGRILKASEDEYDRFYDMAMHMHTA